jgi:hypothetical protein
MPIATARQIGHRPRRKRLWTSRDAFFTDLGIFLLGVSGAYSVNLVGALPGNEILLFPLLPLLLLAKGSPAGNDRDRFVCRNRVPLPDEGNRTGCVFWIGFHGPGGSDE